MQYIKNILFSTLLCYNALSLQSQSFTISPFIGIKAGVTKKFVYESYYKNYLNAYTAHNVRVINPLMIPPNFGFTLDYRTNKNCYSLGLTLNDGAESLMRVSRGGKEKVFSNFYRVPVTKISFDFCHTLFERIAQKEDKKEIKYAICFFTGINYNIPKNPPRSEYNMGVNYMAEETIIYPNDTITFSPFTVQYPNHKNYLSCKFGTSINIYRKSKIFATISLYYEQGIRFRNRIVEGSGYFLHINRKSPNPGGGFEYSSSRGSAIQLKLAFPITVFNKE